MIDLEKLKSDEFGMVAYGMGTYQAMQRYLTYTPEVEMYRRSLEDEDFPKIEKFIDQLLENHYDKNFSFPYEHTLIALSIILAEYENSFTAEFFSEIEFLYNSGGNRSLIFFTWIGNRLSQWKDELSSLKNKVRLQHPKAIFLPLNELKIIDKDSVSSDGCPLIMAAEISDDATTINLIDMNLQTYNIPLSEFKPNPTTPIIDFTKPYLTDHGQTLGFGIFGTYETAIDSLLAN